MKLSTQTAAALKPGEVIRDHVVTGLELHCKPSGAFWFLYYRTATGERRRPKLSVVAYPVLGIEQARDLAKETLRRVARGEDPSAERSAVRAAPTVQTLAAEYVALKAKKNKPGTMKEMQRQIDKYILPEIGSLRVADVTAADAERVLRAVRERKYSRQVKIKGAVVAGFLKDKREAPYAANRVRETLRGMFRIAELSSRQWRPVGSNPVKETDRNPERKRRVMLTETELARVAEALREYADEYPFAIAAMLCILLAGSRVTELVEATRVEFNGATVTRKEHKTDRTGDERVIFLPVQARRIIEAMPIKPGEPKIFGGIDADHVAYVWEKVRIRAGVPHVQVRDFRRTFASFALSHVGVGLDAIGELLGHRDTATTAGYAWLTEQTAGATAQRTADVIEGFMESKKGEST